MKFKVGDKVRIRKDLVIGREYGSITNYSFLSEVDGNLGVQTIVDITGSGNYRLDKAKFVYSGEMLKLVEKCDYEKLIIYRDNNKTIVKYYKGDKTVTAEAKCAPEDEFDFGYGAKLAIDRAIEKMAQEEEIGYSWVKCVGYRQKYEFNFTVGKKYKIYDNGTLISDDDFDYGMANDSKKETLDFISNWYIFEEV